MVEIWKDIDGYNGLYEVSNLGRIKNHKTGRILKPHLRGNGYLTVQLYNGSGFGSVKLIHRLVATAFIPNPSQYPIINHKDEIKHNNNVDNLEWCNNSYNVTYGSRRKTIPWNKGLRTGSLSVETRMKMSISHTGRVFSQESKHKIAESLKRYHREKRKSE